jgi:hypothetical protein
MEEEARHRITNLLIDHDIEGQCVRLWGVYAVEGWLELAPIQLVQFRDIALPLQGPDRAVWRFAQANGMLLVTNNRNMSDADSLEQTIREENGPLALPVITIASIDRVIERHYARRCALKLAEIVSAIDKYLGVGRLYIPYCGQPLIL